jgi:hypothetical protein
MDTAGAGIVGDIEVCLHLDHAFAPLNETISQRFSLERGGHSWISTCWPILAALFVVSVIALRLTNRLLEQRVDEGPFDLHDGGLVHLVGDDHAFHDSLGHRCLLRRLLLGLLGQHSLDAGDAAANVADARGLFQLARGLLETQVELLFAQLRELIAQLVGRGLAR